MANLAVIAVPDLMFQPRRGLLWIKPFVYLERYGRLCIPDESLLGDHEFLRRDLAGLVD